MTAPVRVQLTGRSILRAATVAAGVVAAAWIVTRSTRVLGWVAAAVVVAALLLPLVEVLSTRMRRGLAVGLVMVTVAVVIGGLAWSSIGDLGNGLDRLRDTAPEAAERVERDDSWIGRATRDFGLRDRVESFVDELPARLTGGGGAEAVRSAATRGVAVLITTVLTVFLIAHGPRLLRGLLRQLRDDDQRRAVSTVALLAYRRAWSYVMMILVKAVAVGFLAYGLSRALDLPSSSVLALIAALGSLVPYLGVLLGGLPLILLAGGVHDGWAAALAALGVITLQVVDGWATAKVIEARSLRVGPAVSLATVLLGTTLYGVGGAAVALPIAAFVVAIAYEGLPDARVVPEAEAGRSLP